MSALGTQEGGAHYKNMGIQPVLYIQANDLDYSRPVQYAD